MILGLIKNFDTANIYATS